MSRGLLGARVRVPCSTSNLGAGYDTIGLALERYLEVTFSPDDSGKLTVERKGTLATLPEADVRALAKGGAPSNALKQAALRRVQGGD